MAWFRIRKLYYLANGQMISENADSAANQEVLVAGHLFSMVLKEKLQVPIVVCLPIMRTHCLTAVQLLSRSGCNRSSLS